LRTHVKIIVAHHLVWMGYGHWLSNDVRGSGSSEIRQEKFGDLGPIHHGRKRTQPSREELREFHRRAEPLLNHDVIWFDSAKRQALATAVGEVVTSLGYTVYACAVLRNHVHAVIRRHCDNHRTIWVEVAHATREAMRKLDGVDDDHPVWSDRPYGVFLYTPDDIDGRIDYVNDNFEKHKLPREIYPFVKEYDGWPLRGKWKKK
jgi:hypothetical protein